MIKSTSMWVISIVAVALLVTHVGYRLLEREQSHRVVPSDSNFAEQVFVPRLPKAVHGTPIVAKLRPIPSSLMILRAFRSIPFRPEILTGLWKFSSFDRVSSQSCMSAFWPVADIRERAYSV
jgi:hypothetical protein